MKKINADILKPCDIILTTTKKPLSGVIRAFTQSDVSHAMISVEKFSVIDSTAVGVHAQNLQRIFLPDKCSVYSLRLKKGLDDSKKNLIVNYVRSKIGTEYSKKEAILTAFGGKADWSQKQFCSRLVAQAFSLAGIKLVEDPNYCSPSELKESRLLYEIHPSTLPVTEKEILAIKSNLDMTEVTRNSTNKILDDARLLLSPSIQNLNDLDRHLINNPQDDGIALKIYDSSGYFDLWKTEKSKNEWQYNIEILNAISMPDEIKVSYCNNVIEDHKENIQRYRHNFEAYTNYSKNYNLGTFKHLRTLYYILIEINKKRYEVARKYLAANK